MNYEYFIPVFGVACFVLLLCLCALNCFCKMRSRRVLSTHPNNIYFTGNYPHHLNCPQPAPGNLYMDMQQTSWTMYGGHAPPPPSYSPNHFHGPRLTIPQPMPPGVTPASPPPPYMEENSHPVFPPAVDVPKLSDGRSGEGDQNTSHLHCRKKGRILFCMHACSCYHAIC